MQQQMETETGSVGHVTSAHLSSRGMDSCSQPGDTENSNEYWPRCPVLKSLGVTRFDKLCDT